ncbi:MAG: RNA polymerase sigma factor [Bernardetiaceae bacterium]|nr:RNA polymerase sigma factor [Bernardetiaceae bacterium]
MKLFGSNKKSKKQIEAELLDACLSGKRGSERALYEHFADKMLAVAMRYIGNRFEAEDVLLTAFMKIFDNLNTFKKEGSFEGWIRRIVTNEALGYLRKNRKVFFEEIDVADYNEQFTPPTTKMEAEDLMQLVRALPVGYRTVFNLYAIEGYSHQEIAEQLGINENTSKSQLSRARKLLQKYLANAQKTTFDFPQTQTHHE